MSRKKSIEDLYNELELLQNRIKKEENKKYDMLVRALLKSTVSERIRSMTKEEISLLVKVLETVIPQMYTSMHNKDEIKNSENINIGNYTKITDLSAMNDSLEDEKTGNVNDDDLLNLNNFRFSFEGYSAEGDPRGNS